MPGAAVVPSSPPTSGDAYVEHAPPAPLASVVACFWSRGASAADDATPRTHRVLPDGCVDVLVTFDASGSPSDALAVGAMTRPMLFADTTNTGYLAARFRPGAAALAFGVPASELTDRRVALSDLWDDLDAVVEALGSTNDAGLRLRTMSAAIARRVLRTAVFPTGAVGAAVRQIEAARGNLSVGALARDLGVTRQHLARSFAQHVGLSPKLLARIVRARAVVDVARWRQHVDWSTAALDAGYYDQAHLAAEIRELTGLSPTGWLGSKR